MHIHCHAWINFTQSLHFLSPVDRLWASSTKGVSCISSYMFFFSFFCIRNDVIDPKACVLLSHRWVRASLPQPHPDGTPFFLLFIWLDGCQSCFDPLLLTNTIIWPLHDLISVTSLCEQPRLLQKKILFLSTTKHQRISEIEQSRGNQTPPPIMSLKNRSELSSATPFHRFHFLSVLVPAFPQTFTVPSHCSNAHSCLVHWQGRIPL